MNWVKATICLFHLKTGLENFVKNGICEVHEQILSKIAKDIGLPNNSKPHCDQCTTNNVTPCFSRHKICRYDQLGNCKYHDPARPETSKRNCPNNICHRIAPELKRLHSSRAPHYMSTDATKWCAQPLELAKCFLVTEGYKTVDSIDDIDCAGLLTIIESCKHFEQKVDDIFVFQKVCMFVLRNFIHLMFKIAY